MPEAPADRYAHLARQTALQWAQRVNGQRDETDVEQQTIALVIEDLDEQVTQLNQRNEILQRLVHNLSADMLYALEAEIARADQQGEGAAPEYAPVGYIARGWRRERALIAEVDPHEIVSAFEGARVSNWLDSLPEDHFKCENAS